MFALTHNAFQVIYLESDVRNATTEAEKLVRKQYSGEDNKCLNKGGKGNEKLRMDFWSVMR